MAARTYWSYSSWSTFQSCPAKYKYRYVDNLPDPGTYATVRGTDVHTKAEEFLKGNISGVPRDLRKFSSELSALRKHDPSVEAWWRVDRQWRPVEYPHGWFVGKTDAYLVLDGDLHIIDFKTGRVYPDKHADQGAAYAALGAAHYRVEKVSVEFWYLDSGETLSWEYGRKSLKDEQERWTQRGIEVMSAREFPATPNYTCKWCPYKSSEGGPCTAWKKA